MSDPDIRILRRSTAAQAGITDSELRRQRRGDTLSKLSRGCYVPSVDVADLHPGKRHRLRVQAMGPPGPGYVLSHVSAAAWWDLALLGAADLSRVHFTRVGVGGGRITAVRHDHPAQLSPVELTQHQGMPVTTVARTLVDLARTAGQQVTVVAADHALHGQLITPVSLGAALAEANRLHGMAQARRTLALADGRAESPGETVLRLTLPPSFDAQVEIRDGHCGLVGRVDFADHEAMLIIEFDGRIKYRADGNGRSVEDVILAEKRREDALRELGYLVIRVVWSELYDIPALMRRIERARQEGLARRARGLVPTGSYFARPRIGL